MRFKKAFNVWETGVQDSIMDGTIKLQRGQWVRCGDSRPSRFVRVGGASIWCVHYSPEQSREFSALCAAIKIVPRGPIK